MASRAMIAILSWARTASKARAPETDQVTECRCDLRGVDAQYSDMYEALQLCLFTCC